MKTKRPEEYIIFPLDVATEAEAKKYVELLAGSVGLFKVGLELFIRSGPAVVSMIRSIGKAGIFLDLKLHDIPATVGRAMAGVADLGVDLATVHCGENPAMLEAAVNGSGGKVRVLGVTVLTSVHGEDIRNAGFREAFAADVSSLILKRAGQAKDAGCSGIVCSGLEVRLIKETFGKDFIAVTPGIRPAWEVKGTDDQKRVTTPAMAVSDGSDYLVIGRPIRNADDPRAAAQWIAEEIDAALA